MERTTNVLAGCKRQVQIHLEPDDLKPHYQHAYQAAQAEITMKGFRKGKVPISVIRQTMGRQIETDALETIADSEFRKYAKDEAVPVVGTPALVDIRKESDAVTFVIEYEILPEINLGEYRNIEVDKPVREATDADVQREIEYLRMKAATFQPAEQITDTQFVATISMNEVDKETSMPIIGAETTETKVYLDDDSVDMHLRNSLHNGTVGTVFTYVAETADPNAQPPSYRVTITDIQKVVPADFTDEFVEQITENHIHTTEELKADIRRQIQAYFDQMARQSVENQIVDKLVLAHDFDVPESLTHAVIHQLFDDFKKRNEGDPRLEKLTAHDLEHELRDPAVRIAKWELIRQQIIAKEGITLTKEDIDSAAERTGLPVDQLNLLMARSESFADRLLSEKAMDTLLGYAVINTIPAPTDESAEAVFPEESHS
ncbi:MAG: trigger factor [Flavobacteriales bacterium]|nr:MAG: trigger factor [Chlorobi bacterium OLB6]MBE2265769.1 trigger factor [Flavobacteriales bacterium]MBV6463430.1 Trigger factor [Chlorobiota bacterium]MBW7854225.1 trigger factor [Candidatus Kapabacteria bacterium]MCC6330626.1 trigger factor [Ignavibacteria bacterium]